MSRHRAALEDCAQAEINDIGLWPARAADGTLGFNLLVGGGLSDGERMASDIDVFVRPGPGRRGHPGHRPALRRARQPREPGPGPHALPGPGARPRGIPRRAGRAGPLRPRPGGRGADPPLPGRPRRACTARSRTGYFYVGLLGPGRPDAGHRAGRGGTPGRDLRRRHAAARHRPELHLDRGARATGSTRCSPRTCWPEVLAVPRAVQPGRGGLHRVPSSAATPSSRPRSGRSSGPASSTSSWPASRSGRPRRPAEYSPKGEDAGIIRMHFSGCSASCAQPQIADIGFRGDVAHVGNHLSEAVDIGMGGSLGTDAGFIDWIEGARPVNDVPDALLRVVRRYQSERRDGRAVLQLGPPGPERRAARHPGRRGHRHAGRDRDQAGGRGMKAYRIREEINGIEEPPGKTWFFELQAGVIDAGRCIQCGTCVAACPSNSIGIDEDTDLPELVKMCTGLFAVLGLLSPRRAALRGPVAAVDPDAGRHADEVAAASVERVDASRHLLEDHRWPPRRRPRCGHRGLRGAGRRPSRRGPGRRGGVGAADRRAGRRRHRRRPGHPAERRPRRAVEGRGPPGHHGQGDHRRGRQLLQPDHGAGRARPVPVRPAGQAADRRGGHAVRDPGDPGHAGAAAGRRAPTASTRWC